MKAIFVLILILAIISIAEMSIFVKAGEFISAVLRADIFTIIECILHNETIIKDINVIIDGILTKDFNKFIQVVVSVIMGLIEEIKGCINPKAKLFY